jgi:hypothetical protein
MGFEPTTASLEGWNSTTELRPPITTLPILTHPIFYLSNGKVMTARGRAK